MDEGATIRGDQPDNRALIPADPRIAVVGGEFRDTALEAAFRDERGAEAVRHSRIALAAAAILNALFLVSDWRFAGTPHFWVAVPARLGVVAAALVCLALSVRHPGRAAVERVMIGWMALTALGVGALVTSHSDIALFVVLLLPAIFYLAVPVAFRWTLAGGVLGSLMMFLAYGDYGRGATTGIGIALALVVLNTALALNVTRTNRLARVAWFATENERRLGEALAGQRRSLERMFAACPVPLVLTDPADGRVLRLSDSCGTLLGTARPATLREFYAAADEPDGLVAALDAGGGAAEFETPARLGDGSARTLLIKAAVIALDGRPAIMSGLLDITARKAAQANLELLASTDPLTGLRNRLSFFAAARAELMRAARGQTPLTLLMIDIDHFKRINDTHGHQAGDAALRAFAALMTRELGMGAVTGRLGGEEFVVLLPQTATGIAARIAETLRAAAAALPIEVGGDAAVRLTISIGVAGVRTGDRDIDGALARADLALYAAKHGGRDRVIVDAPSARTQRTG